DDETLAGGGDPANWVNGLAPQNLDLKAADRLPGGDKLFQRRFRHPPHRLELKGRKLAVRHVDREAAIAAKPTLDDGDDKRRLDRQNKGPAQRLHVEQGEMGRA